MPLLLEVGQEAAVGHEGHDDVRGSPLINADPNQPKDVGMVEIFHLDTLLQYLLHLGLTGLPWSIQGAQ